jgi:hypothetical protein
MSALESTTEVSVRITFLFSESIVILKKLSKLGCFLGFSLQIIEFSKLLKNCIFFFFF